MILDGKVLAQKIHEELTLEVNAISGRKPTLAVVLVGEDPASKIYVRRKIKACEEVGINSIVKRFESTISEDELLREIEKLNVAPHVDGILIQLPLPEHIDSFKVTRWVNEKKDVDGFHPTNVGNTLIGLDEGFRPCTPLGVQALIDHAGIDLKGKHVVIVGRSNIVGKPLAAMLVQRGVDATVTITHRYCKDLKEICLTADVLVVAIGVAGRITTDMIKEGTCVIDVGINRGKDKKLVGDVDFHAAKDKCSYITPVPGGVGPMTIAMLLKNTLKACAHQHL